jgi:predicted Ser/Thr protein kinase
VQWEELPAGTRIGAYATEAQISSGGMGAVYSGHRVDDGAQVALKLLLEARNATRLEIEARLLARLRHPRVVRVLEHVAEAERHCLVMELVHGPSLAQVLADRGPLPADEAVEHVRQACEAVAYVHAQHVVHRDVKPANLILSDRGVVLVDFGIARETSRTDHGTRAIGTPRFMAPEVLAGGLVSPRSDVFGLAATLWTLVAGEPPGFMERARLSDKAGGVGREVDEAVRAGLEPDPYLRLPSVDAFARALGEGLGPETGASLGLSVERTSVPPYVLEAIVRSAAGVFGAAAASIALVDARPPGELVYESAWGAGADEIVGVRLPPGHGIAGAVVESGEAEAIASCREDPRFALQLASATGYIPNTMLVLPLLRGASAFGVVQVLDRRDGEAFGPADVDRGEALLALALAALDVSGGETVAP